MTDRAGRSDVVIVGGGITGCAAAYYLAARGVTVRVVERGRIAGEQSSRAWGFVRQQGRHPAEVPLAAEASRLWPTLERTLEADLDYVRGGILVPAETASDEARLVEAVETARQHGVGSRMVTSSEAQRIMPELAVGKRAALYTEQDGHAEPIAVTQAFAAAARRSGVDFSEGVTATAIETSNGRASGVVTSRGVYGADAVLCAGGIGTAALSRSVGVTLPIQVVRASVAQTNATRPFTGTAVWAPHAAFRPKRDGSFYVGNGYREIDAEHDLTLESVRHLRHFLPSYLANWKVLKLHLGRPFLADLHHRLTGTTMSGPVVEPRVNPKLVRHNERQFYDLLPHLRGLGIARMWAGNIDTTPDLIPIIEPVATVAGYYVAAGFSGHGFALGPIIGKLLAELILDGKPSLDLTAFRLSRFAEGDVQRSSAAL